MSRFLPHRSNENISRTPNLSQQHPKSTINHQTDSNLSQPDEAILLQTIAQQWQQLADNQEQVVQILHAAAIRQREILATWESMDPGGLEGEAQALEDALQDLLQRAVHLVGEALEHEQQTIQDAASALIPERSTDVRS